MAIYLWKSKIGFLNGFEKGGYIFYVKFADSELLFVDDVKIIII